VFIAFRGGGSEQPGFEQRTHTGTVPIGEFTERQAEFLRRLDVLPIEPKGDADLARAVAATIHESSRDPSDSSSRPKVAAVPDVQLLADTLWAQLIARSRSTADAYFALVDADNLYRLVTPSDPQWSQIEPRVRAIAKIERVNRNSAKQYLEDVIVFERQVEKNTLTAAATGAGGAGAAFRWISHGSEAQGEILQGVTDQDMWQAWMAAPAHVAIQFRIPKTSLEAVIARDGRASISETANVVETVGGARYVFHCVWYHDPHSRAWILRRMIRRGTAFVGLSF